MYPSLWQKNIDRDVKHSTIVIGGGIAGLALAYFLSQKGIRTTLLEQDSIGSGASGRNAGFLTGGSLAYFQTLLEKYGEEKALNKWFYTKSNIDLLRTELELDKKSKSFLAKGTLTLLKSEETKYEKAYTILKQHNYPVTKIKSPLNDFKSAFHFNEEAFNNPMETLNLIKKKIKHDCQVLEGCSVLKIHDDVLETNIGNISYTKVFVATNASINLLCPEAPVITPKRAQIAYYRTDAELPLANIMLPEKRIYLRKYEKGVLIGGLRLLDPQKEETGEISLNEKIQNGLFDFCQTHFAPLSLERKWSGIMGFTHDELPVSGKLKDKNIYYLGGFSGHGNGYAFKMAKELVETI